MYKLYGLPQAIITDRDRIFTSRLWQELFRLADVQLKMSSSYHPQTDGQTERVNQCLETYLRCFVNASPKKWVQWLSVAQFWYNSSYHSALDRSPFEVLYGFRPRHFGISATDVCEVPELETWLKERELMQQLVRQHLLRAQQRMKKQADKHRSERSFKVGEWVFLKLQPYVQASLAPRSCHKLAFKFFGPYQVLAKIGGAAYKLQLPSSSAIHPVFHVSQLKKMVGEAPVTSVLPDDSVQMQVPEKILQRRLRSRGLRTIPQVLVKWSSLPASLATWEDQEALQQQFPFAPAWGQAGSQEEGGCYGPW